MAHLTMGRGGTLVETAENKTIIDPCVSNFQTPKSHLTTPSASINNMALYPRVKEKHGMEWNNKNNNNKLENYTVQGIWAK